MTTTSWSSRDVTSKEAQVSLGASPSSLRAMKRQPAERARFDALRARSDELAATLDLAEGFAELIRERSRETLVEWPARSDASSDPDLRRFAEGIRRDEAAVRAAVTGRSGYDAAGTRAAGIIERDTAGEFGRVARRPGFRWPGELILPRLRLIGGRREFASSIESAREPK
jgi:hypothetical protein